MPKPVKAPIRAKRPRAEVQQEFSAIREDAEAAKQIVDPKREESLRQHEAEIRAAVDGISVEGVVRNMSGLSLEISKALGGLSDKLVEEVNRLASVRQAVELVQDYRLEKERQEAEIAAQRAGWEEESQRSERERKENEDNLKKQRQREIDDYEYKKTLERKRAQDKYDEDVRVLEKKNKEKQEMLEKDWARREAVLKEQEEELARLRKESQDFPARLRNESEQAAAQGTKAAEARFEQQLLIMKKDAEADKRVAELRVKALEEINAGQAAQIASLQKQLDQAKQQVQEIALQAI